MCEKGTSQGTRFLFLFIEWKRKRKNESTEDAQVHINPRKTINASQKFIATSTPIITTH